MSVLRLKFSHLCGASRQFLGHSGSVPDPWDLPSSLLLRLPLLLTSSLPTWLSALPPARCGGAGAR